MIKFEPFVCDHAAGLMGRRPWEVSRNPNLLFEALAGVIQKYKLDLCLVGMDIYNVEAEALGCTLEKPEGNNLPAISRPLCSEISEIKKLIFDPEKDGRLPMIIRTAARLKEHFPDCDVRVPICGPYSLAAHLLGIENLLVKSLTKEDLLKEGLRHLAENLIRYVHAIYSRNLHVTVFESTATPPLLSPSLFEQVAAPALRHIFDDSLLSIGKTPALVIGGNTLPIIDCILALRPSYIICPVETDQKKFMQKIDKAKNMRVRVNMSPSVFMTDAPESALAEASRALRMAYQARVSASVGLLLPFAASECIVTAVSEFIANSQQAQNHE